MYGLSYEHCLAVTNIMGTVSDATRVRENNWILGPTGNWTQDLINTRQSALQYEQCLAVTNIININTD